jgi:hypothetical protein
MGAERGYLVEGAFQTRSKGDGLDLIILYQERECPDSAYLLHLETSFSASPCHVFITRRERSNPEFSPPWRHLRNEALRKPQWPTPLVGQVEALSKPQHPTESRW